MATDVRTVATWTRMTGTLSGHEGTARRSVFCTDDPRADPALLARLQARLRRYCGDALLVPTDARTAAWADGFAWAFDVFEGGHSPFACLDGELVPLPEGDA
jgi:hypothetical protein